MDIATAYKRIRMANDDITAMARRMGDDALIQAVDHYTSEVNAVWYELLRTREQILVNAIANANESAKLLEAQHDVFVPPHVS